MEGKWQREFVTPHRVALLVVIKEVCGVRRQLIDAKNCPFSPERVRKMVREFSIAVLNLVQVSDMEAQEFQNTVSKFLPEKTRNDCTERLTSIYRGGVSALMDYVLSLDSLLVGPAPVADVNKSSILGLFLRRTLLAFGKLSFGNVTRLFRDYQRYYLSAVTGEETGRSSPDADAVAASRRQAELFVARQAALLSCDETRALPPRRLRARIEALLRDEPAFADAHFLNYMNSVRVKEYCDAVHSVRHGFDCRVDGAGPRAAPAPDGERPNDRNFRFAALNLAVLLHNFGHDGEAENSLRDAVRMAQDAADHVCLQHALSWLCRLSDDEAFVRRSVGKSCELGLPYLASVAILKYSRVAARNAHEPYELFEFVSKSDAINCQHSLLELTCVSYAQKAGLWDVYGKRGMSCLCAQLLLNLNASNPALDGVHLNSESHCLALCRMARFLAEEGEYARALTVIEQAARRFPQLTPYSDRWMIEESGVRFRRALLGGRWAEAEAAAESLAAFSGPASDISHVELLAHRGNLTAAREAVGKLLRDDRGASADDPVHYRVRLLLLSCDVDCRAKEFAVAVPAAVEAVALCRRHRFAYLEALATAHLANVKLHLGTPALSLRLLRSRMRTVLSHGPPYDRHRVALLYHRCRVAACGGARSGKRTPARAVATDAARSLTGVAEGFRKLEAFHRVKQVFHAQAVLFHELGLREERNGAAFKLRVADLQCNGTATVHWQGAL